MKEHSFPRAKIKIFLAENIHSVAWELLRKEGFQVEGSKSALSEADLIAHAKDAHILGIRSKTKVTKKFLSEAKKLLSVGCFCIGTDQVELGDAGLRGVTVFNAPFSNTRSVAEMVLCEIVMLARRIGDRNTLLHAGKWDKSSTNCREVRGKTLGIIGYGHIGSQVSVLAESFGMKVIYYDVVTKMPIGNSSQRSKLEDVLKDSDFVTLHVPDTNQTRNMIGSEQLKSMKKGSYLINASRGKVVDIKALKSALAEAHLSGAAIDVFPEEPESNSDPFKSELQNIPNVILTPHLGGSTEEAQENIGVEVATSITRFINNGSSTGSVNFPQVDLPVQSKGHRILNVHKNVPGVLKDINSIISDLGANIEAQYLATDPQIGYLIVDLDKKVSDQVKDRIKELPTSIKTRILY
ncbi:MAG: D-3-phosphoglycerate dehydrogenase [Bacteriovoracaceae bacterium]|nr:D-3-phosphoglycerate dehydrogenase [Bacteriovoracaceae bacterium]